MSEPRKILAADLSSHTGWAVGRPGGIVRFGTYHLPSTGDEIGRFLVAFGEWFTAMLDFESPDIVIYEAPILPRQTTPMTARKLMGLASHLEVCCLKRDLPHHPIPCREVANATVKKFLAGHGFAKKPEMIAAAKGLGFDVKDDNQADALGIFGYACKTLHPNIETVFDLGRLGQRAR